jgi:hypothetical protein
VDDGLLELPLQPPQHLLGILILVRKRPVKFKGQILGENHGSKKILFDFTIRTAAQRLQTRFRADRGACLHFDSISGH